MKKSNAPPQKAGAKRYFFTPFRHSREVENIFENSDFVYLLNQAHGDKEILAKSLNISESQQNYITNVEAGEGLIIYGSIIVPFVDNFPKNTKLYRLMTTKLEETNNQ